MTLGLSVLIRKHLAFMQWRKIMPKTQNRKPAIPFGTLYGTIVGLQ